MNLSVWKSLRLQTEEDGQLFFAISAVTNEGVRELLNAVAARLNELSSAPENKPEAVELAL